MNSRAFAIYWFFCVTFISASEDPWDYTQPVNPSVDEDGKLSMSELANKYGYPMETHKVLTKDNYILTMYRMPYGRKCQMGDKPKIPVLIQHGMLSSSFDFLILGPEKALGYLLADECYDVWMGNNRGNSESKNHTSIKPSKKAFWSFSWHEMGQYDLPAEIDYILKATGQPRIHYIGHSQGTTQFFVFGSLYPEYHQKIRSMHALSPVSFMKHLRSPIVRVLSMFSDNLKIIADMIGLHELFPNETFLNFLGAGICRNEFPNLQAVCCNLLFLLCGFDEPQMNKTMLPAIIGHTPAGSSVKQMIHYSQGIKSGEFRHFDYGALKNLKIYKSLQPPKYDVQNIKVPIAIYYGENDYLASVKDVKHLMSLLPNVIRDYLVPYPKFNHLDFIYASSVKEFLYDELIRLLKKY